MPKFEVTTKSAEQVWKSPDGQRTINKVVLDYNGSPVEASTYSSAIATVGFKGEVETYEKPGKFGVETFVKQPPKEGGYTQQQGGQRQSSTGGGGYSKSSSDNFTMYLSYAKDLAIALQQTEGFDVDKFKTLLKATAEGGHALYSQRPEAKDEVKGSSESTDPKAGSSLTTKDTPSNDEPVDTTVIDKVFDLDGSEVEPESPWKA